MQGSNEEKFDRSVLVVVADPAWRATAQRACRAAGVQVRAMGSVAEVERWPDGVIVITDTAHVTPLWKTVGAVEVIALVNNPQEGYAALHNGASTWLPTNAPVAEVSAAVRSLVRESGGPLDLQSESQSTTDDVLQARAENAEALNEFFSEGNAPQGVRALREDLHDRSTVAQNAGSPITLRPKKDRRRAIRERPFRWSSRTWALVALVAVIGGSAGFAVFRVWVASRGTLTSAVLRAPAADVVAKAETTQSDAIPSSPVASPIATVAAVEGRAGRDLTGSWVMTNQVQASSYRRYEGLRIGYRLRLRQEGTRIIGDGHKWSENGRAVPRGNRTPITVAGVRKGGRIALRFSEGGRQRETHGAFDLEVIGDGRLRGKFKSDAARSRGSSVAERIRNDDSKREVPE